MRTRWFWVVLAAFAILVAACFPNAGPIVGNFHCPVFGSRYTNSYGLRGNGFHYGIDMIAPMGTPTWAVKSGNVRYALESAGGLAAYLVADDGNAYYYAHMSNTNGGNRRVGQGEHIGYVGQTGNATGPHLHFEIRLGGVNGQRVNPYNTLIKAGC